MRRLTLTILATLILAGPTWSAIHVPRNRAVIIPVGPLVDFADGVTPELAMTATNISCTLARRSDAGGAGVAPTLVINTTLTAAGGSNDLVLLVGSTTGLYGLELTASQISTAGTYKLSLSDPDVMAPWFTDLIVDPNVTYDSLNAGTDYLQIDVAQWKGATAPANTGDAYAASRLLAGTVATAGNTRTFTLSAGFPAAANRYPAGTVLTFTDATTGLTYASRLKGYSATRVVTVDPAFAVAPEVGDAVALLPCFWPFGMF